MSNVHDPFRCPHCRSARTRSMRMIAMSGGRVGRGRSSRVTIGARGWWSLSGSSSHWASQTELAKRYTPSSIIGPRGIIALLLIGALLNGVTGAVLALLLGGILTLLARNRRMVSYACDAAVNSSPESDPPASFPTHPSRLMAMAVDAVANDADLKGTEGINWRNPPA